MANEASQSISLKVLVDAKKNRVVFAESDNDFVDVLFSVMTMPIGTIIRLTLEPALKWEIGCLNNLYESIEILDNKHLQSVKCKEMLLHPQNAAELYCSNLKLNFVNNNSNEYYGCGNPVCPLSTYQTACCRCGSTMSYGVKLSNPTTAPQDGPVFVRPTARFMITDDFRVTPMSTMTGLTLLSELKAMDGSTIEERTINIGRDEVLKLLKCSLTSKAAFSETILESPVNRSIHCIKFRPRSTSQSQGVLDSTKQDIKITLKLIVGKSINRVLYAEAKEDFVDLISSFLTFPLGYIFKEFPCLSLRGCLGNLYNSIQDFDVDEYLKSKEMKAILVDPKLAPGLACNKQLIPIKEASYPSFSYVSSLYTTKRMKSSSGEAITGKGFIKGPSLFMVTDNFTITPLSPISCMSLIKRMNVPLSDIREREVTIGGDEALHLLEAALVTTSALSYAFLLKPKQVYVVDN